MDPTAEAKPAPKQVKERQRSIGDTNSEFVKRTQPVADWRTVLVTFAFFFLVVCTWIALRQEPRPVGVVRGPAWTWEFWRDVLELNSIKRLPSIDATLLSVFALKDANGVHVWVGGRSGVLLHSPDSGQHWEQISPVVRELVPEVSRRSSFDFDLSLVSHAQAQQQQLPSTNKGALNVTKSRPPARSTPNASNASVQDATISVLTTDINCIGFDDSKHGYVLSGGVIRPQGGVPSVQDLPDYKPATLYETKDGGKSWTARRVSYDGEEPGVLVGQQAGVISSDDTYTEFELSTSERWSVGDSGSVLHSTNAGATWLPQTQGQVGKSLPDRRPSQYPAPWYYVALCFTIGMAAIVLKPVGREKEASEPEEVTGIANLAITDRPLEPDDIDVLGCRRLALALSSFIRNLNTIPPLTIAVTGEWGSGKSSVMNLLRRDLEAYRMRPIWFNAWHNQTEENLFATLLQNLRLQGIPRWWQIDFVPFRWRLLIMRLRRSRLPLLVAACIVAALGGFELSHPHSSASDIGAIQGFFERLLSARTFISAIAQIFKEPLVLFLAGLASLSIAVFGKLKAFGIDPASLLSSSSNRPSISDLEKQTSIRQRFAVEFCDITKALGPRRMVIFIDDLDRCQPDNACQVLEAVNFIVSSGECFVVMGLARRPVEACVGLSFSRVAEEMTAPSTDPEKTESPASLRSRFARQYLDKLINIEIPVPATDGRAEGMIAGINPRRQPRARSWRSALPTLATLLGVMVIYGTFNLARTISAPVQLAEIGGKQTQADRPVTRSTQPVGTEPRSSTTSPPRTPIAPAAGDAAKVPAPPVLVSALPTVPKAKTFAPFALMGIFALIAIAYVVLTRRAGLVVQDSPEFLRALDVWKEFIVRTHPTPRAIKRFMNRVRCTAMRIHPVAPGEPLWSLLLRRAGTRSAWVRSLFAGVLPELPSIHDADISLRESSLVALTAIYDTSPKWLDLKAAGDSGWLRAGMLPPSPNDWGVSDNLRSFLGAAIADHEKNFPQTWPPTPRQLSIFLELMGSLISR
jgi:KAP family P-loop domain